MLTNYELLGFIPFIGLIIVIAAWSIVWKGYALWIAAKNDHKWWFIILLIVNTVAILEIIYIFAVGRPSLKDKGLLKEKEVKPM